jgi:hypothetical protein
MFCIDVIKYRTARDFYRTGRKISRRAGTCPGHDRGGAKRQTLYFLTIKMKSKFFKLKILQRIIGKFPAIK